jgi:predicted metal-dependent hydrolase
MCQMTDKTYTIADPEGNPLQVTLRRDKRLRKTSRWERTSDGGILLRVPYRLPKAHIPELLDTISTRLARQKRQAARRTDADLQQRANYINRTYFGGRIEWRAIRWVEPMKTRLGSCTGGGSTDGHIRISKEINAWPQWVIDYVIAHEMAHRVHANHSKAFWEFLQDAYPPTERARGFIQGIGFARGKSWEEAE